MGAPWRPKPYVGAKWRTLIVIEARHWTEMAEIPENQVLSSTGWFSFSWYRQNMFWRKKSKKKSNVVYSRPFLLSFIPGSYPSKNRAIWWWWKLIAGRLMHHNLMLATGSTVPSEEHLSSLRLDTRQSYQTTRLVFLNLISLAPQFNACNR